MTAVLVAVAALLLAPPSGPAVRVADAQHGWVAGRGGILATSDGGRTWRRQASWPVLALEVSGRRKASAIGRRAVLATVDGVHWRRMPSPQLAALSGGYALNTRGRLFRGTFVIRTPGRPQAVCFDAPGRGWVARGGTVWRATNGGRGWASSRLLPAGRQGTPIPQLGCRGSQVWVLFHEGAGLGTEGYQVFRSLDGGVRWRAVLATPSQRKLPSISNYSGPFSVLGRGVAVFVGRCDPCGRQPTVTIVRTTNGGRTWTRATPLDGYWPYDVSFADPLHGFMVTGPRRGGSGGLVWKTVDGGRSWRIVLRSPALVPTPS